MTDSERIGAGVGAYMPYAGIGSRDAPPAVLVQMTELASLLFERGYTLRSGAADGADKACEAGGGGRTEIYLPWRGFNGHASPLHTVSDAAMRVAARFHPAWDRCTPAAKKLHARNVYQVLGQSLADPARFILCWTKDGKASGGTGQALRMAAEYRIPIFNLHDPEQRSKLLEFV